MKSNGIGYFLHGFWRMDGFAADNGKNTPRLADELRYLAIDFFTVCLYRFEVPRPSDTTDQNAPFDADLEKSVHRTVGNGFGKIMNIHAVQRACVRFSRLK